MKLEAKDLVPQESTCLVDGKSITLRRFTLRSQIWVNEKFTPTELAHILKNQYMPKVSKIVFYLLKDNTIFKTLEDFQESLVTEQDKINIYKALLESIGLSQPVLEKLAQDATSPNAPSPSP